MPGKKELIVTVTLLLLFSLTLYIYKPVTFAELSSVEGLVSYARSFESLMPVMVFLITVVQAILPVIPFVILCSANGILFGLTDGVLLTWAGTLTGASLMFFVARRMGYDWAAGRYKGNELKYFDEIEGFRGFLVVLGFRLLPYFPAPLVNVAAGVSPIQFRWFFLASALGKLPFILGYTLLGYSLLHSKNYILGAVVMAALLIIPYLLVRRAKKRGGCC